MTREEQIIKTAKEYYNPKNGIPFSLQMRSGFITGAKWADEHPNLYNNEKYHTVKVSCLDELNRKAVLYDALLEKACEWLGKILYIHTEVEEDKHWGTTKSYDYITSDHDSIGDFITDFRKAMEE